MEIIKTIQGHQIKKLSREEINTELIAKGDWSIEYFVPGRIFYPWYIVINKEKYKFSDLNKLENFCSQYPKKELKDKTYQDIISLIEKYL